MARSGIGSLSFGKTETRWYRLLVLLPALTTLFAGLAVQSRTFLNHDAAWVLYSSMRLLEGGTFGTDIVAANPPLIWWISALPRAVAATMGLEPVATFRVFVAMLAVMAIIAVDAMVRTESLGARVSLTVLAALLLSFGVYRDFGQREHLAVMLCLPWLAGFVLAHRGHRAAGPQRIIVGALAGLGIALKPHFVLVPVLVILGEMIRKRSLRPMFALETVVIVLTGAVYLGAVWIFARPFLDNVAPAIARVYWGFAYPLTDVLLAQRIPLLVSLFALILARAQRGRGGAMVLALAAIGFFLAGVAQAKGYSYHFYPIWVFGLLSLAMSGLARGRAGAIAAIACLCFVVFDARVAAYGLKERMAGGVYGDLQICMNDFVKANVPEGGGFIAFSTHPFPGFPTALYSDRDWLAETNSRLFLPSIVKLRAKAELTDQEREMLDFATLRERAAALRDLGRHPALVLVDGNALRHAIDDLPFNYLEFYQEDPAFAQLWQGYHEIESCAAGWHAYVANKS